MSYMKNSAKIIKKELFYQVKSKSMLMPLVLVMGIVVLHLYGLYSNVINNYNLYLQTKQMYIESGIDIVESLKETNFTVAEGNSTISSNPLKEDFVNLAISIENLERQNIVSNTLEYFVFVFGTLIFGVYAAYIAAYDYKYKTNKFFATQYRQREILTGKICSVFLVLFGSLLLLAVVANIASPMLKYFVQKTVPTEDYIIPNVVEENNLWAQMLFTIAMLGFYIIVSYTISYLFKNMVPVTIFLLLYTLLIPVLGKYDIKNICSFFAHRVFSFQSRFVVFEPAEISVACGVAASLCMLAAAGMALFFASKRSLYN